MSDYYLIQNQQQVGPLTRETVLRMLDGGEIGPADLAWRTGLDAWRPVPEVVNAPAPTGNPAFPRSASHHSSASMRGVNWTPALAFCVVTVGLIILYELAVAGESYGLAEMFAVMSLPWTLAAIVFWSILHYQCWKTLPPEHAVTTPGKAIGFLYIPFFSFYWAFISWPKLAEGFNRLQLAKWGAIRFDTRPTAIACAILYVGSLVAGAVVPENAFLTVLFAIGGFITFILLYRPLTYMANVLR